MERKKSRDYRERMITSAITAIGFDSAENFTITPPVGMLLERERK